MVNGEDKQAAEAKLVADILKGDERAKEAMYVQHRQRLYATAVHFLGYQDPEAEDVMHEAFAIAYKRLDGFAFRSSLYTWLNHICVNLCFARLRQRRRAAESAGDDLELLSTGESRRRHQDGEEEALRDQRLAVVRRELAAMKEGCRDLLTLRDVEGRSYAAIAVELKVPLGTVMSKLSRCREALKQRVFKALKEGKP